MPAGRATPRSLSLKGRALMWLAQREHSRDELRRKLLTRLRAEARAAQLAAAAGREAASQDVDDSGKEATADPRAMQTAAAAEVDALLDWLEAHRYLSEARFLESRVNARAGRFGTARIGIELARHGVALEGEALQQLRDTELPRAQAVWARKFGAVAATPAERAKQMRFLAGRGFSAEAIRRVVWRGGHEDGHPGDSQARDDSDSD